VDVVDDDVVNGELTFDDGVNGKTENIFEKFKF
jgi:hypothetical protein